MTTEELSSLSYKCLLELATDEGINASAKDESFGCIFGRDSAITILKILKIHESMPIFPLLEISKRTLLKLISLQGKTFNLESGEELGKFIHEFREDRYEHLVMRKRPWFVYPDGKLRNYDSIDSTPLCLIALYKYWQVTQDNQFLLSILSSVEAGLNWLISFGDLDKDLFIEYEFPKKRKSGGLLVQSWTDSCESLLSPEGLMPKYPIAPVEAQAFAWLAMRLWADFYTDHYPAFGKKLLLQARSIKDKFNNAFIFKNKGRFFAAQALDGNKKQIKTVTSNPLLCLWAVYQGPDNSRECILEQEYILDFVKRAFQPDLFVEDAGMRTMSSDSPTFNPNQDSYHNGSFWPMLNGLISEGLDNFGFEDYSLRLKKATLYAIEHFGSPVELYIKNGDYFLEYQSLSGKRGCRKQAWSAAALLHIAVS